MVKAGWIKKISTGEKNEFDSVIDAEIMGPQKKKGNLYSIVLHHVVIDIDNMDQASKWQSVVFMSCDHDAWSLAVQTTTMHAHLCNYTSNFVVSFTKRPHLHRRSDVQLMIERWCWYQPVCMDAVFVPCELNIKTKQWDI